MSFWRYIIVCQLYENSYEASFLKPPLTGMRNGPTWKMHDFPKYEKLYREHYDLYIYVVMHWRRDSPILIDSQSAVRDAFVSTDEGVFEEDLVDNL